MERYKEQAESIEKEKEKKAVTSLSVNDYKRPNKTHNINNAINGAVLDAFRQFGVVYDSSNIKEMKEKNIIGISICNYRTTKYGYIKPFPIIVIYDVNSSRIMVYCDLIDKVEIPYWKAILGLSKLSSNKQISDLNKFISDTTITRRLNRVLECRDKDNIIIVEANGITRKYIKGITNSQLADSEKNKFNQISKLLITDDKYVELNNAKRNIDIIRLRVNEEVPDYIHEDLNDKYQNTCGIFNFGEVYYSIDDRPLRENKTYKKSESKAVKAERYSHRNMIEIYPIFTTGDDENIEINKMKAVEITNLLRDVSIQFTSQMTILPLPLHLAKKMEEYL